jgi:hypothetical protein
MQTVIINPQTVIINPQPTQWLSVSLSLRT